MANNVKIGDIVEFGGEEYEVTNTTSGSSSKSLIGGREGVKSNLLWLESINEDPSVEEIDGWVNERRVKIIRKKKE